MISMRPFARTSPSRSARRARALSLEPLESRQLLASSADVFAVLSGTMPPAHGRNAVAVTVSPASFSLPSGGVLLGLALSDAGGAAPGAAQMSLTGQGQARATVVQVRHDAAGGADDVMLARVGAGSFLVQMKAGSQGPNPFQMEVFLAGDVNGDHSVGTDDLAAIRALRGRRLGQPGYLLTADVNRDGVINILDLRLAQRNLGASTTLHPFATTLAVDHSSDLDGNGVVLGSSVLIDGHTAPGATVLLLQPTVPGAVPQTVHADAAGLFQAAVNVPIGVTPVVAVATDSFGQHSIAAIRVKRGDEVIAWDQTMLNAIRADRDTLGLTTRTTAMVTAAMFDAVNDIERQFSAYKVDVTALPGASPDAAAATAAYVTLLDLLPKQKPLFDATLTESLATLAPGPARDAGMAVGYQVALGMMADRANDGSSAQVPYTPGTQPGQWRPTPPDFTVAWGPEWGQVTTFAIPNATQFMPPPPPSLTSDAYTAAFNEAKSLGSVNSTTRTPEQTLIGKFWGYDVAGIGPPPVFYNEILQQVSLAKGNTLEQNARLFALANIAMADAGIVAWDTKFTDNFWRPITAIHDAAQDGNPNTVADPTWQPLGAPGDGVQPNFTPPFPAYISGHATFGGALFTILADFYGTDHVPFTITSDETPGVYRSYTSFSQAAEENGQSRIYLGIHWQFDKVYGISTGDAVGSYVFQHELKPVS